MSNNGINLLQGKPLAFTFERLEDDGQTQIPLPANCGFRMQIRATHASDVVLLEIRSTGVAPRAERIGETFQIEVPASLTAAIPGPFKYAKFVTDIELFDLDTEECIEDGGAYLVHWYPEATR